jgi:hypothetical protein
MKNLLVLAFFLIGYAFANAQESDRPLQFGVKAGINFADITGDDVDSFSGRTSIHFGVYAEIPICESFSFQPELLYSAQGSEFEDTFTESDGEIMYVYVAKGKVKADYLNVPLMAKYYVTKGFSIEAGPQVGFLLSAKEEYDFTYTEGSITETTSGEEDIKDSLKGIDFGLNFGLGYKLDNGLNFGARYNLGLLDINDDPDYLGNSSYKNSVIQVSVGFMF